MASSSNKSVPVIVLAGFLGAGKTTVLNYLLTHAEGRRLAVVVNDFGGINIDEALVTEAEEGVISLENGCICCNINEDLVTSVVQLTEKIPPPDAIIIEASGVADPAAVAFTFSVAGVREFAHLDSVVSVADGPALVEPIPDEIKPLMQSQIAIANLVMVNKTDLMDHDQMEKARHVIDQWSPDARMVLTARGEIAPALLLGSGQPSTEATGIQPARHPDFDRWEFSTNQSVQSLPRLHQAMGQLPHGVLRMKGIVHLADSPFPYITLHKVGKRVDFYPYQQATPPQINTRVVALGLPGSLHKEAMDSWFEQCLVIS